MEDWFSRVVTEKRMRNSFLINRKPTQSDIFRIKDLFEQIEKTVPHLENSLRELENSRTVSRAQTQMREQTIHLAISYASLKDMIAYDRDVVDRLFFDLVTINRSLQGVFEKTANLYGTNRMDCRQESGNGDQ